MPSTIERLEENKIKLTIEVTPEQLEEGIVYAYSNSRDKINIPGFRKGRVPRKLVEAQFGKNIFYEDAIDYLMPLLFEDAVEEHKIDPVSKPDAEIKEISASAHDGRIAPFPPFEGAFAHVGPKVRL